MQNFLSLFRVGNLKVGSKVSYRNALGRDIVYTIEGSEQLNGCWHCVLKEVKRDMVKLFQPSQLVCLISEPEGKFLRRHPLA